MKKLIIPVILFISLFYSCATIKKGTTERKEGQPELKVPEITDEKQKEFEYLFVEALKEKMIGNPQRAIALLSSCLKIDPNSAASMYELANIYASNNDFTSAALLLDKAISINPQNKWYKLFLARIYQQSGKFEQAAEVYQQLMADYPDNLDMIYMDALMLKNAGKYDEAINAYNRLEKEVGHNEQIVIAKQNLYVLAGKIKEAFAEIQKLIDLNPKEAKYYGLMADLYLSQGDKENALKYYNKILQMEPDNGFVQFSLSNYYEKEGDYEKAFEHTKLGFASKDVDLETKLQVYLMLSDDKAESKLSADKNEELIKLLIKTYPDDPRVYTVNAEYLIREHRLGEARAQLLKVLELNKSDYVIWERVLFIDNDLQDWQALYNDTKSAIELFPNQPQVYFLNGVACIQLEKYEETLKVIDEGLEFVVDNPPLEGQMVLLKAEANYKLNDFDKAYMLFDKAIELNPDNYVALNNYAYYLSERGEHLDKAERMSGRVVEKFPDNPTYLDTYAWVLFKKRNYGLAKFYIESAMSNGGQDNPTLLEHYGDILFMLNKIDEAKKYWVKAKEEGAQSAILDRKIKNLKYYEK